MKINTGVPKHSISEPTMYVFLIYVNDIGNATKEVNKTSMYFADDSSAVIINKDLNQIIQN